jgi:hypothetical protein
MARGGVLLNLSIMRTASHQHLLDGTILFGGSCSVEQLTVVLTVVFADTLQFLACTAQHWRVEDFPVRLVATVTKLEFGVSHHCHTYFLDWRARQPVPPSSPRGWEPNPSLVDIFSTWGTFCLAY